MPIESFKTAANPETEPLTINPEHLLLHQGQTPNIDTQGALIAPNGRVNANLKPENWRVRRQEKMSRTPPVETDRIPWNLSGENKIAPLTIHPNKLPIGPELEGFLAGMELNRPGIVTTLEPQLKTNITLDPELRLDTTELKTVKPLQGGFPVLLEFMRNARAEMLTAALKKDQITIIAGSQPLALTSKIHPHPYLQRAGRAVANLYLAIGQGDDYYQRYISHLIPDWNPDDKDDQNLLPHLTQFNTAGLQTNLNIPENHEGLAVYVGNYLAFSEISIALAGILNSTPAINGVVTDRSDVRLLSKRVLSSANPQELFQPLAQVLDRVNQQVVEGWVPTIARGMCLPQNGHPGSVFHGSARLRGDRSQSSWEDMLPSPGTDELQAAYCYIKACQASYLIHCYTNKINPDQDQFNIPDLNNRESLLHHLSLKGPQQYAKRIKRHLEFLRDYLTAKNIHDQSFEQSASIIIKTLAVPAEYGINQYLTGPNQGIGLLSDHIRAEIYHQAENLGVTITLNQYHPEVNRAIHAAYLTQTKALRRLYQL